MMNVKVMNSKETKEVMQLLENQFGIGGKEGNEMKESKGKLPYVFLINSKDRLFVTNRDIGDVNLSEFRIDSMGVYFGQIYKSQIRLSLEGSQIVGRIATKGIVELDRQQMLQWMKGEDIPAFSAPEGVDGAFVIVRHGEDFIGCGKVKEGVLWNYVSKTRALKVVNA